MEREAIRKSGSVPDMSCVDVEDPGNQDGEPEVPESEVKKTGRKDSCFRFGDVTVYEPTSGVFYVLPKDSANGLPGENSPGRRDDVSRVREIRKRLGLTTSGSLKLDSRPESRTEFPSRFGSSRNFNFPPRKSGGAKDNSNCGGKKRRSTASSTSLPISQVGAKSRRWTNYCPFLTALQLQLEAARNGMEEKVFYFGRALSFLAKSLAVKEETVNCSLE